MSPRVAVIGAGLSGTSCARALRDRGIAVDLIDRGHRPGGRMASPRLHDRRVDVGAAYFTAKEPEFVAVVEGWVDAGRARGWTDTFQVVSPAGLDTSTGPLRYAAPDGLRALVDGSDVRAETTVTSLDEVEHDAVVLAMPDPQAARLAPDVVDWVAYEPVIAVIAGYARRGWPLTHAAFVNDDPDVSFVADDGSRRGDGAPVLVAHSTADRARRHLDHPDDAVAPVLAAVSRLLQLTDAPDWTHAHRWTFAKPVGTHGDEPFGLVEHDGRPLGLCGDSWCPSGAPRVESAWLSGHRLGWALAERLG